MSGNVVVDGAGAGVADQAAALFPREIAAGRVFQLGGFVELDGRVSWAPLLPQRVQPVSCYVILEDNREAYLVDTGIAVHQAAVVAQLRSVLADDVPLRVIFTRAEYECVGNLGAIHSARGVDEVVAAGMRNPFDAYDEVARSIATPSRRQNLELGGSRITKLAGSESILLIPPLLRLLATYWVYDKVSKVLFTSDLFAHTDADRRSPKTVISSAEDETTYESARAHLLEKFGWLRGAHTKPFQDWFERFFGDFEVEAIAPTHGCVLQGRALVEGHVGYMLRILKDVGL